MNVLKVECSLAIFVLSDLTLNDKHKTLER